MKEFADFDTIMERLSLSHLWNFPGGVHPKNQKTISNKSAINTMPLPERIFVPIKQHIGVKGELLVKEGDTVLKGQALTVSKNSFSVPVHASSSGVVRAIKKHPAAHPSGLPELVVEIELDGKDDAIETQGISQYAQASRDEIISAICDAGISGLGGAGFPTHIKSNNAKAVEFLIINGVECEPYISADDRLMREHAWQIRQGIDILHHLIGPKQVIIAIEDNKPEAFQTMSIACQQQSNYQVISVPTKYPAGGEKQLIQVLTSREVPSSGLPIDVGCIMYNVGTCFAVADAIIEGKALTERVVTVTGGAIKTPQNVWAKIGTPIEHLLKCCEFEVEKQQYPRIIMGGPMMGFTLPTVKIPVVKITNCILAPENNELPLIEDERACIRCSACADACPASLLPQQLFWYSKAKEYETAKQYDLFDCIECGACAYVCPSEIPLVHYYRKAKSDIRKQTVEKDQAEKARIRFEARKERLEKEKHEREEKHRLAAEARKQATKKDSGGAKDKIAAALARAKAKKAAQKQATSSTKEINTKEQKPTQAKNGTNETADSKAEAKKKSVAAAVAKAKARKKAAALAKLKEQKNNGSAAESEPNNE